MRFPYIHWVSIRFRGDDGARISTAPRPTLQVPSRAPGAERKPKDAMKICGKHIQCGAPKIAKLVNRTTITVVFMVVMTMMLDGVIDQLITTYGRGPTLYKHQENGASS